MFYVILLILTLVPFLLLTFLNTTNKYYKKATRLIVYIWIIIFAVFILMSAVYFSSFIIIILLILPLLLRYLFNTYKDLNLFKEINNSFYSIFNNFTSRGILIGILTILSILIFYKFDYLNTGIYLVTLIFIILTFNMQSDLNKNFGLYFILATFWSLLSSSGNIQTNLLIAAISLFIPLIPISIYKPFAKNTYIHIFSFLIFICLYEILKSIDVNELTQLLIKLIFNLSILTLGISLLLYSEKNIIKMSNYYLPLIFVSTLFLIQKFFFVTFFDFIIIKSIDTLISTLLIITCLRFYGYILANSFEYTEERKNISLYIIHKTHFTNWIGQNIGEYIWKITLGDPTKKKKYYYLEVCIVSLITLIIFLTHLYNDSNFTFSINTFPWEVVYILLSLQLINSLLSINVWFHIYGHIDETASNSLTSKMFVSLLSILICILIQNWHLFGQFNIIALIIFVITYFVSLALCFSNLTYDLVHFTEKKNLQEFKMALAPLFLLITINITVVAFFFNFNNINITYIGLAIICLILGIISGKFSDSIFSVSKYVLTKFNKIIIGLFLLIVIVSHPEVLFSVLYYLGYYTTTSKN